MASLAETAGWYTYEQMGGVPEAPEGVPELVAHLEFRAELEILVTF
jgi:hypothetical protein